eukprot:403361381
MALNMSQTLYNPSDHKWKTPQQVRSLSLPNIPNKKYMEIVKEIVKGDYVHCLHSWIASLSEQHKRGLRVVEKIIEIKGAKRFKQRNTSQNKAGASLDLVNLKYDDAQKEFRKMTNTTHYAQFYGMKPKAQEDYEILKFKRLSELQMATIIKPHITQFIENWIRINDQEEYTGALYQTLREIYTVIRNQQPPKTLVQQDFIHVKLDPNARAPRYDKLILQHKGKKVVEKQEVDLEQEMSTLKRLNLSINRKKQNLKFKFPEPLFDPKQFKQSFFSGHGNITGFCDLNDPKLTDYQETFKGKQIINKFDRVKRDFHTSICGGGVIPDPASMGKTTQKFENYKSELKTITQRFLRTAQNSMEFRSSHQNY